MARVEGEAGRYVTERLSRTFVLGFVGIYVTAIVLGVLVGVSLVTRAWPAVLVLVVLEAGLTVLLKRFLKKAEEQVASWKKGLDGEILVGRRLALDLPDEYRVIHDLKTDYGNLDHVVVGPTGVFAVETKNWKGTVTSDGKGELLWNGKPADRPHIRNLTRRIMSIRERWVALAKTDRFIRGVMVFSSAYEDAQWGTTGNVHCTSIDGIPGYFLRPHSTPALQRQEVDELSRAFLALARMDEGFDGGAGQPRDGNATTRS